MVFIVSRVCIFHSTAPVQISATVAVLVLFSSLRHPCEQILSENSKHGSEKLDKVIKTLEEAGLSSKVLQLVKEHLNSSDVAKSPEGEI